MKDGDKAKAKAAKAKTSGKEVRSKSTAKEKGGQAVKAAGKKESSSSAKSETKAAAKKSSSAKGGGQASQKTSVKGNGKTGRPDAAGISFTNPTIESAFNRAVKKYPNAFRKLTD